MAVISKRRYEVLELIRYTIPLMQQAAPCTCMDGSSWLCFPVPQTRAFRGCLHKAYGRSREVPTVQTEKNTSILLRFSMLFHVSIFFEEEQETTFPGPQTTSTLKLRKTMAVFQYFAPSWTSTPNYTQKPQIS